MRTEIKIIIEDAQDWINNHLETGETQDECVMRILAGNSIKGQVRIENELEGPEAWCKKCHIRIATNENHICEACRQRACHECPARAYTDRQGCEGCEYQ